MNKLGLYMLRWQLSTPILALVPIAIEKMCGNVSFWTAAFISNLIGSLIFYWIDRKIFRK